MYEYQIGLEDEELKEYPEAEAEELALIYQAKGLPEEEAHRLAHGGSLSDSRRSRHCRRDPS